MPRLLFSRRSLQANLDALKGHLTAVDINRLVERLNAAGRDRVSATWEVALLASFNAEVSTLYEAELPDGRRPDLSFDIAVNDTTTSVIADITTISDQGLEDQNPIRLLADEFVRLARKRGINPDRLSVQASGALTGEMGKKKMILHLPSKSKITAFSATHFTPFLENVSTLPTIRHEQIVDDDESKLAIAYDPTQMFFSFGYPSYNVPYSLSKNPLANALHGKSDQLSQASEDSIRLIIITDGGSHMLRESQIPTGNNFQPKSIVDDFLRQSQTVDGVLLIWTDEEHRSFPPSHTVKLSVRLIFRPNTVKRAAPSQASQDALRDLLNKVLARLPSPLMTAANAFHRCKETSFLTKIHGGYRMSGNSLRVPMRQVLELLAGQPSLGMPQLEALPNTPLPRANWSEFFEQRLKEGRLISSVNVIKDEIEDEDWLEFLFSEPDPAISPFKAPRGAVDIL
jgi:hypothetical protein